jgi:hypothetical protein
MASMTKPTHKEKRRQYRNRFDRDPLLLMNGLDSGKLILETLHQLQLVPLARAYCHLNGDRSSWVVLARRDALIDYIQAARIRAE